MEDFKKQIKNLKENVDNNFEFKTYVQNWTLLQQRRNCSQKELYLTLLENYLKNKSDSSTKELNDNMQENIELKKYNISEDYFLVEKRIHEFDSFLNEVYSRTGYVESRILHKNPENLGVYKDGETYVFIDAQTKDKSGNPENLSGAQKDIIDAHEKIHKLYEILPSEIKQTLKEPFSSRLKGYKDKYQADEILARMAQLKNYFGFTGSEEFTKQHLDFAKSHYVEDTKLDNTMNDFFEKIEKEDKFIENMNTIPC